MGTSHVRAAIHPGRTLSLLRANQGPGLEDSLRGVSSAGTDAHVCRGSAEDWSSLSGSECRHVFCSCLMARDGVGAARAYLVERS